MENDLRLKIVEYFSHSKTEREQIIEELTKFYFDKNVSLDSRDAFEKSIDQLIFSLQLEYQFALKSESYNRVEIYQKLARIFWNIKEKFIDDGGV